MFHTGGILKEGISGNRTLSDPLESSVDQETRVVLGVPVFHEDEVIGILCGSCNVGELSQMLFDDLFSGNGYSLIVTKEGKIVAHTGEPVDHKFSYGEDIFTFYNSKTTREGHSISEVKQNFAMGEDGWFGCLVMPMVLIDIWHMPHLESMTG